MHHCDMTEFRTQHLVRTQIRKQQGSDEETGFVHTEILEPRKMINNTLLQRTMQSPFFFDETKNFKAKA